MVYTYTNARQNLSAVLDVALKEGEVKVRRKNGEMFIIRPEKLSISPLDVQGLNLGFSRDEILDFIRDGRKYVDRV